MPNLPLTPRDGYVKASCYDIAILIHNIMRGMEDKDIGYADADRTFSNLRRQMSSMRSEVPLDCVESALWSCNMLDEKKKWKHPEGITFDAFLTQLLGDHKRFNKDYNWIED